MNIVVLTLFPELVEPYFTTSIPSKAVERGLISYTIVNFRDFARDRHRTCDDAPYGGGAGMVIKPEPLAAALDSVNALSHTVVYPSAAGYRFTQQVARDLSREETLIFICGRYEGVDQRVLDFYRAREYSIGDYVLSSGELAALVMIDAVIRLREGVITRESLEEESYASGLLEYPHYTRPVEFRGMSVPDVLLSGHHEEIRRWRLRKSLERTLDRRPDLLHNKALTEEEKGILKIILEERGDERATGD